MNTVRVVLVLIAGTVMALNAQAIREGYAEPQYVNSFYGLDTGGGLIELERQMVTFRSKMKAFPGYASVKLTTQFKPGRSPVRLPSNAQFIVRGRSPVDPVFRYELHPLKGSKDHREFVLTQSHGSIVGGGSTGPDEGAVPLRFEEYGTNSYRITPAQPLAPGEYALATRGRVSELFCFGVDQ
jgi:hypothetical protein